MLLLNFTIDNFGVFRTEHSFELAPQFTPDSVNARHLTIFSGHNGAGKTTIFQALMIALYGQLALGDRVSSQVYNDFILRHVQHRSHERSSASTDQNSKVTLEFQYFRSGLPLKIRVERHWQRHGRTVKEQLQVFQNDRPPEIDPEDYQFWLNDLAPPGLRQLNFFDAEQLDTWASPDQQSVILNETLERLLGLDFVQRLQTDIEHYISRQGGSVKIEHLYEKVLETRAVVDEVDYQLAQLRKELNEVESDIQNCEVALAQQERLLASEGGAYAARRPLMQNRLQVVRKEIEIISGQLRDLSADLLPFALVPELCQRLSQALKNETMLRHQHLSQMLWKESLPDVEKAIFGDSIWEDLEVPLDTKQRLTKRILEKLLAVQVANNKNDGQIIHHLAEPEQERLQQWIAQALQSIPQQVIALGKELRGLREEQRRIESDLQKAPDDQALIPIHTEISRLRETLIQRQRRRTALTEQIGSLQFQRSEKFRLVGRATEQYEKAQQIEKQMVLADRSKLVLRTYKDALTLRKLNVLETALVDCFNVVCRKDHLISSASIDPNNFTVHLKSVDGRILDLGSFSAGERQIYALALLWALRQVAARQLPLVVDTPLARLDEMHRSRFIHDYVPKVSDQVLLFVTDTEVDPDLLAELKPYLAHIYRLHYDSQHGETEVTRELLPHLGDIAHNGATNGRAKTYGL